MLIVRGSTWWSGGPVLRAAGWGWWAVPSPSRAHRVPDHHQHDPCDIGPQVSMQTTVTRLHSASGTARCTSMSFDTR
jgi:hypothetical protein